MMTGRRNEVDVYIRHRLGQLCRIVTGAEKIFGQRKELVKSV